MYLLQVGSQTATPPICIVRAMPLLVVPEFALAVEVVLIDVLQRTQLQVPIEGVRIVEWEGLLVPRKIQSGGMFEAVIESKSAVSPKIITQPLVHGRGLRGNRNDGRMRIAGGHQREFRIVGDAKQPYLAVAVRNVLDQPSDCIPGVGRLVSCAGILKVQQWSAQNKCSLGPISSPDRLANEDVAVLPNLIEQRGETRGTRLRRIVSDIRRSIEQNTGRPLAQFRVIDLGVQPDPVAHRNHDLGPLMSRANVGR